MDRNHWGGEEAGTWSTERDKHRTADDSWIIRLWTQGSSSTGLFKCIDSAGHFFWWRTVTDDEDWFESSSLVTLWWTVYSDGFCHMFHLDVTDLHEPSCTFTYGCSVHAACLPVLHTRWGRKQFMCVYFRLCFVLRKSRFSLLTVLSPTLFWPPSLIRDPFWSWSPCTNGTVFPSSPVSRPWLTPWSRNLHSRPLIVPATTVSPVLLIPVEHTGVFTYVITAFSFPV